MTVKRWLTVLVILGIAALAADRYWPRPITEAALSQQLAGAHCRFAHSSDRCEQRGFEALSGLLVETHDCDLWAVQCLADMKSPEAVTAMIDVLTRKTDVETCDGLRPIRTSAVVYLGNAGDRRALPALRQHLASNPTASLSAGASGCSAGPEDTTIIRDAISKLETP